MKINPFFLSAVQFLLMASLVSCGVTNYSNQSNSLASYEIQILKPSEIELQDSLSSFAILFIDKQNPDEAFNITKTKNEEIHENTIKSCLNGLYAFMKTNELLRGSISAITVSKSFDKDSIDWNYVKELSNDNQVDVLIFLNRLKITNKKLPRNNSNEKFADLELKTTWTVLIPSKEQLIEKDIRYKKLASYSNKDEFIYEAANYCGEKFGKDILPSWQNVSRNYFVKGNDDFKNAAKYVVENNLDKAAEIWEKYKASENHDLAGMANHNLALYFELQGNLDKAFEFAKTADQKYKIESSHKYAGLLYQRIKDQYKLAEQIKK